ncbi:MAG: YlxR family protein [Aquiluna sp.]|nr:YlxR family protein [Aquiluna sp.]MCF8546038.1 YlxR family protein [Aquiluna sp.]
MEPQRTCIGCRQCDSQQNLIRATLQSGSILIDESGRNPGRGAWFHEGCAKLVLERKGFQRALGATDLVAFEQWLEK